MTEVMEAILKWPDDFADPKPATIFDHELVEFFDQVIERDGSVHADLSEDPNYQKLHKEVSELMDAHQTAATSSTAMSWHMCFYVMDFWEF